MRIDRPTVNRIAIGLCLLVIITLSGCKKPFFAKKYPDDNVVEEVAEALTEDFIELTFELPDESLAGKIDFTPWSKEANQVDIPKRNNPSQ